MSDRTSQWSAMQWAGPAARPHDGGCAIDLYFVPPALDACSVSSPRAGSYATPDLTVGGGGFSFHPGIAPINGCGALFQNFVAARVEPGSQSRRDSAESYPVVRRLRHASHDGASDVREAEQVFRVQGEVCRARD